MFAVYCPHHQSRVLLGSRSIQALVNTGHGVELHWRCRCGAEGTLVTGALAEASHADEQRAVDRSAA